MPQKPPAFQFYAKDWLTSPTVNGMTRGQQGDYIRLLAAAWNSDEPGTLPLPVALAARISGVSRSNLARFLQCFPSVFVPFSNHLVNKKLHDQWLKYKEISEKRSQAASKSTANASHSGGSAFAFAFASAQSKATTKEGFAPPTILEIAAYMRTKEVSNPEAEAQSFFEHHANRDWRFRDGRGAKMKDWRLAVGTWKKNIGRFGGNKNGLSKGQERLARHIEAARLSESMAESLGGNVRRGNESVDIHKLPLSTRRTQ